MERWLLICILLCSYGLFKSLRPSEPFDVQYLVNEKNITQEDIVQQAYPVATYVWFSTLPFALVLTTYLNYKPIIYVEAISIAGIFGLMIWGEGLQNLKVVEALYGLSVSAEIAYLTYIYAQVEKIHFHKVTSFVHSATFIGTFSSAILSQFLVSFKLVSFKDLHYMSFGFALFALFIAICLPRVPHKTYITKEKIIETSFWSKTFNFLTQIKTSYNCRTVIIYSIWWSVEKAGNYQVVTYYKALVQQKTFEQGEDDIYTAGVQAVQCALSVTLSVGLAFMPINWKKWGPPFLCLVSVSQGLTLFGMAVSNALTVYVLIVVYRVLHQVTVTMTSSEVAKYVEDEVRGFIFGVNVFIAAGLQVMLTITVSSETVLGLAIDKQFLVYSGFNLLLGIVYLIISAYLALKESIEPNSVIVSKA